MNMKRIDIKQHDVFISWTGADRELKNQVVDYLRKNDISCLESDHQCSGDFRQWSREAVGVCNIFLPIVSSATFQSKYVPIEIEEYKKLEQYENRIVPVWTSQDVFGAEPWNIKEYGSSVILDENGLTETALKDTLDKVVSLIINLLDTKYKQASKSEYIKLISLSRISKNKDHDFDFSKLFINRTLCETDENGDKKATHKSTDFLYESNDISFIYGPAGCGKSQYINQIRENAPDDVIIISLPCSKIISSLDVFSAAFKEFSRVCSNRYFYTESDFVSLINNRKIMLVFDGIDEIATIEDKRKLISKAEEFYKSNRENTILVFTGRNVSDADLIAIDGKKVRRFLLEKLNEDEIRTLSEKLFVCFERENEFNTFFVKVSDLNEEIRSNPMLLSQLAIIYDVKNDIPKTVVGIYDAISEIILKLDNFTDIVIPDEYKEMVSKEISGILKDFSKERYLLLSKGKNVEPQKIFSRILKTRKYEDDIQSRSEFLVNYLESRAIFVDGEFYHKMFLEYFTAVKYYESAFDDYDEIEDVATVEELFSHYADPYWSAVIKMFLVKADSLIDENTTKSLYELITCFGICEYTILFDTCRDLLRFKEYAQNVLVSDIIKKSAEGVYPAYGPLFWYVPEYGLYEACLIALESLQQEPGFAKMLALVRDVCFIMGGKYTAESFTDKVSSAKLFAAAQENLSGVRKALCELFYLGETDYSDGEDVYPRCFNISEAKSFMKNGCGVIGRMSTPFSDELGLFSHTAYNELNDEFIGIVSCPYVIYEIESRLSKKSCRKLTGLILSSSENTTMEYIAINRRHINVMYLPENILCLADYGDAWNKNISLFQGVVILENKLLYHSLNFSIPYGITEISVRTFRNLITLESVVLPSSVKKIEGFAFSGCSSLKSINIPSGVSEIGLYAFEGCSALTSINIPDSVMKIGSDAFSGCSKLISVNIPDGVTKIEDHLFDGCCSLKSVNIPDGVTRIGSYAFRGCSTLTSVNIPNGVTKIEDNLFVGCCSLKSVNIPDGVTEIGFGAFGKCTALAYINIPDGVVKIDLFAFSGCSSLISLNIPDSVSEIGYMAFGDCDGLISVKMSKTFENEVEYMFRNINSDIISFSSPPEEITEEVTIPYGATEIKSKEFRNKKIKKISIPESVTKIGGNAFEGCRLLESINIPDSITIIGESSFKGCRSLKSVNIPFGVTEIRQGAFEGCLSLTSLDIPDSVTKIEDNSFIGCCSLKSVNIPFGVTEIQQGVFDGYSSLILLDIPDSVTKIGANAFRDCSALKSINIPDTVTEIGRYAFSGCSELISVNIPSGVSEIGSGTFWDCSVLTSINIPNSVKKIGADAFKSCWFLTSINIPDTVTEIGRHAFSGCLDLTSINIPDSVTEICEGIFSGCSSLISLNIPNSVTKIEKKAFEYCRSLRSINIPNSVTEIEDDVFKECSSLTSINIPDSVTEIRKSAFSDCSSLTSINIPDSVTKIREDSFNGCSSLASITIPSSVRIIGDDAFDGCSNLTSIKISRRFEDDISRIFGDVNRNIITFID